MTAVNLDNLPEALGDKLAACRAVLRMLRGVVIGYSGGVDSTLLLAVAMDTLGEKRVLAATATGEIFPRREQQLAVKMAGQLGARLVPVEVRPLRDAVIVANPPDRCLHCKKLIFSRLKDLADSRGFAVCSGTNADDVNDYRPGLAAEKELHVRQPLREAGLTKADVRELSRAMGLPTADLPSMACLASRVPYGQHITEERVARIDEAEEALRALGFVQVRVRDHDPVARVEVPPGQIPSAIEQREAIVSALKQAGYRYVALDMEGFRSGSLNETLENRRE